MKRVVISGIGVITPLGNDMFSFMEGIKEGKSAVRYMDGWKQYGGLNSLVGAPAQLVDEKSIPRRNRRSMGRLSIFAVQAADRALEDSKLDAGELISGRVGCIMGSTMGSASSLTEAFEVLFKEKDIAQLTSTKFFQCVSHTAAMNTAQYLKINGCVMATSAACASSLQAVGAAYDLIRSGQQDAVFAGGAEELHPTVTGSFDILFATSSHYNDSPSRTPRPFDRDRDGLVCGEGAGVLVLEEYERAVKRNAKIYAEIKGYNTCGSGEHVSQSDKDAMIMCMRTALSNAGVKQREVDYVSAHATATLQGDKAEVEAIKEVLGKDVPVNSLKGYIGHTLGASGSIELAAALMMMEKGVIYPTLNLENVAEDCEGIDHVMEERKKDINIMVKNCFAFGGINASLVCAKYKG